MPVNVAGPSNDIESGDIAAGAVTIPKLSFDPGTQAELEAAIAAYIAAVEAHRADTTVVHGIADTGAVVLTNDARLTDQRTPPDGSVTVAKLSFDPATQAELDAAVALRLPVAAGQHYRSQRWYAGHGPVTVLAAAMTLNKVYLVPFDVAVATAFDRIGVKITNVGSAGSIVQLGLYADDGTWAGPTGNELLALGSTIDGTSATAQAIAISQTLQPGRYWLAAVAQVSAPWALMTPAVGIDGSIGMSLQTWEYADHLAQTGVSGALPSPVVPNTGGAGYPLIYMRAL